MNLAEAGQKNIALVVDDDPESLGMLSTALEQDGMTVLVARDGRSAINLTRRVEPDVILMDAVMPEMDGFEACRILKLGPEPVLTPIIFMTGLSDQEHIVQGLRAGGVDYVTKPLIIEELLARLRIHLVNSRLLKSARSALDASGQSVLAFQGTGALLWGSMDAQSHLAEIMGSTSQEALVAWVSAAALQPVSAIDPFSSGPFTLQYLGTSAIGEVLVRIRRNETGRPEDRLVAAFQLTQREAEVLYWLTLGKTNRDISAILGLSARTVNKHLEQVFQKMGVDNRTSAAVIADRELARRS